MGVDELGVDEMGVDKMGEVDEVGINLFSNPEFLGWTGRKRNEIFATFEKRPFLA